MGSASSLHPHNVPLVLSPAQLFPMAPHRTSGGEALSGTLAWETGVTLSIGRVFLVHQPFAPAMVLSCGYPPLCFMLPPCPPSPSCFPLLLRVRPLGRGCLGPGLCC